MKGIDEISTSLKELMNGKFSGSRCVLCTAFGYEELLKYGYEPKICFGFAAFSVNKEQHGIISFGEESDHKYMEEVPNVVKGHYWLMVGKNIIDFSLLFLEETRDMLDMVSGIKTGEVLLSNSPIVSPLKNKPLIKLQRGAIAHHYKIKQTVEPEHFFLKYIPKEG